MKKILITGNSGYIGSHLTKLLETDYDIHGLDINQPQRNVNLHYAQDIRSLYGSRFEYDAVIHLAALVNVGESESNPESYYQTNLIGTLNILKNIKYKSFILASTGAAQNCDSAYGTSKKAAEDVVREYCTKKEIPYTSFRFYNVIGSEGYQPTNPDGLMTNLIKAMDTGEFTIYGKDYDTIHGDGTCVRDYVHVMEICDAIRTAIEKPSNSIECLGHGVGYTVKEIVNLFCKVNNVDFDIKYGPRRQGDSANSVLEDVSPYMKSLYTIEELLSVDNKA